MIKYIEDIKNEKFARLEKCYEILDAIVETMANIANNETDLRYYPDQKSFYVQINEVLSMIINAHADQDLVLLTVYENDMRNRVAELRVSFDLDYEEKYSKFTSAYKATVFEIINTIIKNIEIKFTAKPEEPIEHVDTPEVVDTPEIVAEPEVVEPEIVG
jgi:hypothetical protein